MTDNLDVWRRFEDIDPNFTKPITGKPYKGTSPNPHYVIRCLTEMFGPVGQGFGWEVVADGFQPMGEELLHWCRIKFWHGEGRGFDAYGQTKAVMKTRNGFMTDEDAPKKSLTDAITKAAAQVGVGANIFLGRWDDSKYVEDVRRKFQDEGSKDSDPQVTRDRIKAALAGRSSIVELDKLWNHAATAKALEGLHPAMRGELVKAYGDRATELSGPKQ